MSKDVKNFLIGIIVGMFIGFLVTLCVAAIVNTPKVKETKVETVSEMIEQDVQYFDTPRSYEGKTRTSFKIFEVEEGATAALALEKSGWDYYGNAALVLGKDFYTNQIIELDNPQMVGTFSYETNDGRQLTVPVFKVD